MKIDAHQHFWQYDPVRDAWIDDAMTRIRRDFMPGDVWPHMQEAGFDGSIAVQAHQSEQETEFLLRMADENDFIKGVVGWVDLNAAGLGDRLDYFASYPKLKGFRAMLQGKPAGALLRDSFMKGMQTLQGTRFRYDMLIYENQLAACVQLVEAFPEMYIVIDHIAKPNIAEHHFDDWSAHMQKLAAFPHVYVKLSGMVTEADWSSWSADDIAPYMDRCLELFGAERMMVGSDWPVCLLAGEYAKVVGLVQEYAHALSAAEYEAIMGKTAAEFYQL